MSNIVKLVQGPLERIPAKSEQGAIYYTTDECIHLALPDGEFKTYGHYLKVDTYKDLPASANTSVLYFVKDKNSFYRFDEVWKQIESSELTDYVNQTKSDLTDYVDDTKDSLTDSINTTKTDLTNTINSTKEALEKSISDTDTKLDKKIDDTKSDLEGLVGTTKTQLEQSISSTRTDIEKEIETTESNLTNAIAAAKQEAIETILGESVSADFDTLQEVADWIQSDTTSSTKLMKRVNDLEKDMENAESNIESLQNADQNAFSSISSLFETTRQIQTIVDNPAYTVVSCVIPAGRSEGDINGDGMITEEDIAMMEAHNDGTELITDETMLQCARVNRDGTVSDSTLAEFSIYATGTGSYVKLNEDGSWSVIGVDNGYLIDILDNWSFGQLNHSYTGGTNQYIEIGNDPTPRWGDFYIDIPLNGCTLDSDICLLFKKTPKYHFRAQAIKDFVRIATVMPPVEEIQCTIICVFDGNRPTFDRDSATVCYPSFDLGLLAYKNKVSFEDISSDIVNKINSSTPNVTTATLLVENWDEETLTQTVTVDGILADETKQVVNVKPYEVSSNLIAKIDDNITAIALSENALTFTVSSLPSSEMKFFVEYYPVNYIEEVIPEPEPPVEPEEPETPVEPETISFYLSNGYEFTGEEGMTWEEWVNSEYNTEHAYVENNEVYFGQIPAPEDQLEMMVVSKLVDVAASDEIIADQVYNYKSAGSEI